MPEKRKKEIRRDMERETESGEKEINVRE